ncbi:MAG: anhydro-N-acetylmuramic acid kinase [Spongiibacteraceae bacterium]
MTPTPSGELFIGLMSGTSLDGIDAVLVEFSNQTPNLIAAETFTIAPSLRHELLALCQPGNNEIERLGRVDRQLGLAFARATQQLLQTAGVNAAQVMAIGSHGQTIRHRPHPDATGAPAFTLQIGDANTIAQHTRITTIADFRRRDIAAGGQGAPLVPAFHRAAFAGHGGSWRSRVILNIGGMANITALPQNGITSGFDTGPGNVLLDGWIQRHRNLDFDRDGQWAGSGIVQADLLSAFLSDPFFATPPPKSTGREHFNAAWLQQHLASQPAQAPVDVQATLAELTARSIVDAIANLPVTANEVFVCGGGAYNRDLMLRLERLLHPRTLGHTGQLGIAPEWVEAAAFAWLARETLAGRPGNEPGVTGASEPCILGAIYRG